MGVQLGLVVSARAGDLYGIMSKVRTHTFNGTSYEILICPDGIDGVSDIKEQSRTLIVNGDLDSRKGLITLIHEAMHCGNWDKREETVDRSSEEIGGLLWRLGYRRT